MLVATPKNVCIYVFWLLVGKLIKQFKVIQKGCGLVMSVGFVPGLEKNEWIAEDLEDEHEGFTLDGLT